MTTTLDYFKQSELAFAAYASLTSGTPDLQKLRDVDMTATEAEKFSSSWRVIDQYTDSVTGLSATIFQKTTGGPLSLAIRGTEPSAGDLSADGLLALGLPASLNPQFTALGNIPENALNGLCKVSFGAIIREAQNNPLWEVAA